MEGRPGIHQILGGDAEVNPERRFLGLVGLFGR